MAVGSTTRLALPTWGAGSDAFTRAQMTAAHQAIDSKVGIDLQVATAGDLPPVALAPWGTYATTLDTGAVYRCDGAQWRAVSASSVQMADAAPGAESYGVAGAVGVSAKLARADHRHAMPAHDAAAHSGISLSQLAAPTGAIALGGQRVVNVANPTATTDGATKQYVDDKYSAYMAAQSWGTQYPVSFVTSGSVYYQAGSGTMYCQRYGTQNIYRLTGSVNLSASSSGNLPTVNVTSSPVAYPPSTDTVIWAVRNINILVMLLSNGHLQIGPAYGTAYVSAGTIMTLTGHMYS